VAGATDVPEGDRTGRQSVETDENETGWRAYVKALGPGLVTGASDDDPSGVATYAQAGAQFRVGLLWATLVTLPLMAAVQEICDRTALATGKGLGELAHRRFPRARGVLVVLVGLLMLANMLNVAADIVAVLGTTISPYLFFWQSAHRIEELREEPEGGDRATPIAELAAPKERAKERTSRADVFLGMTFSNVVMFAIIVATASTIGAHRAITITSAAQAARALEPVAGSLAKVLFALGFIGSGMLAIPVLAGSGAAGLAGLLHRNWGFSKSPRQAPAFYVLVLIGTIGGTALSLLNVNPIELLVYVAAINGILAAPFLFSIMRISGDRTIMGKHVNGALARTLGWATTLIMAIAAVAYLAISSG
jgi:Mn2+/Fe2+ NRAMP family transporter